LLEIPDIFVVSWGAGAGWINGWYDPESWKDASKERPESGAEFTYKKLNGNALLIYAPGVVPILPDHVLP